MGKMIKLLNPRIYFDESLESYTYTQRIKGKKNYEHKEGNEMYTGCGGKIKMPKPNDIILKGKTEEGKRVEFSIREDILCCFERVQATEEFTDKLADKVAEKIDEIEIEESVYENQKGIEETCYDIPKESCRKIFKAVHPRKKCGY